MKYLTSVFIILSLFACKESKKENNIAPTPVVVKKKEFVVELNYKTDVDGEFKISLNNIVVDDFQKKNIQIIEKVSKTTNLDKITANFGEHFSGNFNFNFGFKKIKKIKIESIVFSLGDKELIVLPEEIENYFRFSKYVSLDKETNTLITKKVESRHVPILFLKKNVVNLLK